MSKTLSVGLDGPSYWAYPAFVLANRLNRIIVKQRVEPKDVPPGVLRDMARFFDLISEVMENRVDLASGCAYLVARDALESSGHTESNGREKALFNGYASLVTSLSHPRELSQTEVDTARDLRGILLRIHEKGRIEGYLSATHGEGVADLAVGLPS